MSTSTFVVSYAYTVTYLTGKMLFLLKEIIRDIGLDPSKFTSDWASYENAVRTWLASRHLERIRLEIYDPVNNALVTFWDIDVVYTTVGDGSLWVDAAAVRYAIIKQGHAPSSCLYDIKVINKPGRETVPGWGSCKLPFDRGVQALRRRLGRRWQRHLRGSRLLEQVMLTANEAFRKFRSNLELTQKEQNSASSRQKEIRGLMDESFAIEHDFLTGSYRRWTKTKPLKDVDIFCVLHDDERPRYRDGKRPGAVLADVEKVLAKKYGRANVSLQRRAVMVEFTDSADEERVMSFDVVPAFAESDHYEIPDTGTDKGWTETDPTIHFDKAKAANDAFNGEWKGMVRMAKSWNRTKIIKPSFLIEVMALDILRPPFGGEFPYEFMAFFATMADRITDDWPEPAGLGPPVSDSMDAAARAAAKTALTEAHHMMREAIQLTRTGRNGDALRKYRDLFGDRFPLS